MTANNVLVTGLEHKPHEKDYCKEELFARAKQGDERALMAIIELYKPLMLRHINAFYVDRCEKDDLIQEGMIALYKAIKSYDPSCGSFESLASKVIRLHMIGVLRKNTRKKHLILNKALSLEYQSEDGEDFSIIKHYINEAAKDPANILIEKESVTEFIDFIQVKLSNLEIHVLYYFIQGLSYAAIAEKINVSIKSIDNALVRIRSKLGHYLTDNNVADRRFG